jgi:hypothetical protein
VVEGVMEAMRKEIVVLGKSTQKKTSELKALRIAPGFT